MKQFLLVVAWVAMGMLASQRATADDNGANIPHPKLSRSIDLSDVGTHAGVKSLCFSPDSRYLAVADGSLGQTMIIVWDLQLDREQSRIVALPRSIGGDPQIEPLWSPDGRSITLGTGSPIKFWNPLTGEEVRQLSIDEPVSWSRYNRDGSKLLVNRTGILGPMAGPKGGFRVYDTRTWQFDDFSNDGLSVHTLSWTPDDNVLAAGFWITTNPAGSILDGTVRSQLDAVARLIDPSRRQAPRSVLLAPATHYDQKGAYSTRPLPAFWATSSVVNDRTNKIALGLGKIIDGRTLEISTYATYDDLRTHRFPAASGIAFSPDGNYLYLLDFIGIRRASSAKSLVLNARTAAVVASFPGGGFGLAASPDGRLLAAGHGQSVDLYSLY